MGYTNQRTILRRLKKSLSDGYRYPAFVQPAPVILNLGSIFCYIVDSTITENWT